MEEETITILVSHYKSLKEDSEFLSRLEAAGVDNWDGYYYACQNEDEDED